MLIKKIIKGEDKSALERGALDLVTLGREEAEEALT